MYFVPCFDQRLLLLNWVSGFVIGLVSVLVIQKIVDRLKGRQPQPTATIVGGIVRDTLAAEREDRIELIEETLNSFECTKCHLHMVTIDELNDRIAQLTKALATEQTKTDTQANDIKTFVADIAEATVDNQELTNKLAEIETRRSTVPGQIAELVDQQVQLRAACEQLKQQTPGEFHRFIDRAFGKYLDEISERGLEQ